MPLDLANSQNWNLLWSANKVAPATQVIQQNRFSQIEDFSAPFLLDSPIVAVFAESASNPGYWRFAGRVFQKVQTGLTVGGTADSYLDRQRIWLDEITIRFFDRQPSTYELEFRIPYWLRQISIDLFVYTGPID